MQSVFAKGQRRFRYKVQVFKNCIDSDKVDLTLSTNIQHNTNQISAGLIGMLDNGLDSGVNSGSESIVTLRPYLLSAAHSEFERVNKALAESVVTNLPTNHDLNQHSQLAEQHTENGAA